MIFPPHLLVALLLQAALYLVVSAATNYSVDDRDPLFQYSGLWERDTQNLGSIGQNLDIDGGHMLTYTAGSSAMITYTFASVYFLATRWPFPISTNYAIDGNPPVTADMQDHSVPPTGQGGPATVASGVVASWIGTVNQEHTILVTIPPGGGYAVVDMFIFEVLDPSDTSSTISSTSQTDSSTETTSETASPSPSPSPSSSSSGTQGASSETQVASSQSHGLSSTVKRDLAISMGVVGASLAVLIIFLLWRFCTRRKGENGRNKDPIAPHYRLSRTIPGNVPLNDKSISMSDGASSRYGLGIQNSDNVFGPPISLNHNRGSSSFSGLPSTLYMNQSESSLPRAQQVDYDPQKRISALLMATDRPPKYLRNSILDESTPSPVSSFSYGNTNEKSGRSPQIPPNNLFTAVADPEVN